MASQKIRLNCRDDEIHYSPRVLKRPTAFRPPLTARLALSTFIFKCYHILPGIKSKIDSIAPESLLSVSAPDPDHRGIHQES